MSKNLYKYKVDEEKKILHIYSDKPLKLDDFLAFDHKIKSLTSTWGDAAIEKMRKSWEIEVVSERKEKIESLKKHIAEVEKQENLTEQEKEKKIKTLKEHLENS